MPDFDLDQKGRSLVERAPKLSTAKQGGDNVKTVCL
jgi:hypothetical protein